MLGASLGGFLAQKFVEYTVRSHRVQSLILCNAFTDTEIFDQTVAAPTYVSHLFVDCITVSVTLALYCQCVIFKLLFSHLLAKVLRHCRMYHQVYCIMFCFVYAYMQWLIQDSFLRPRHEPRHRCQDMRQDETRHLGFDRDKTRLRHSTNVGDLRHPKTQISRYETSEVINRHSVNQVSCMFDWSTLWMDWFNGYIN